MLEWGIQGWLVLVLAGLFTLLLLRKLLASDDSKMPPLVPGLPLIGNAHQVRSQYLHLDLTELSEKYGDIFMLTLFGRRLVAVSGGKLLHQAYADSGEDFAARPHANYGVHETSYAAQGVIFRNWSPTLHKIRSISMDAIMMVGENKKEIEMLLQEEVEVMIDIFHGYEGEPVDPENNLQAAILNIISILTLGKRFTRQEPEVEILRQWVIYAVKVGTPGFGLELDMLPFLRWIPIESTRTIRETIRLRDLYIDKHYQQVKDTYQEGELRCLVDHMLKAMYSGDKDITEETIKAVVMDLMWTGVLTTTAVLYSAIAILVHRSEIQKKLHQEIDSVIGPDQVVNMQFKSDMPYTQAFILEVIRYCTTGSTATKCAHKDAYLKGYFIPKGTLVVFNLWQAQHDGKFWPEPYRVIPERFLDKQGKLVRADHPTRKADMTFGGGKRACIGEEFAKDRIFSFLCMLMQRFTISLVDGAPLPVDDPRKFVPSLVVKPPPYTIKMIPRHVTNSPPQ